MAFGVDIIASIHTFRMPFADDLCSDPMGISVDVCTYFYHWAAEVRYFAILELSSNCCL